MATRALVIGISDYDSLERLDFCKNDGNAMFNLLSSRGYHINNSHNLVGYVTWETMRDAIINFFTDSCIKPSDTLLFYYSGHGIPDVDGDIYFATSEIDHNFPYKRGFSFNELAKMIQRTISTRIVVILDCCYSGSARISKGHEEDAARLGTVAIHNSSRIIEGEGRCLLAASQALQEAYALEEKNHSLFTLYILQGLEGKDKEAVDQHGNVTVDTLSKYVYDKIMSLPPDRRPKQKPIRKLEASGDIVLAHYPHFQKRDEDSKSVIHFSALSKGTSNDLMEEFRERLAKYIQDIVKQNGEANKSFAFLMFLRDIFEENIQANYPHALYPELEKYIKSNKTVLIRGRIDALLGNLIIEFESNLNKYRATWELQLKRYTTILWNNETVFDF